ncbi:MAG: spore coat associated protein CotJA [Firmicutes bacterium]|nr:spore coat associated protein CotJA [Bacillota bacterium]
MPITIGGTPGHRPGDDTCPGGTCPPSDTPSDTPSNPEGGRNYDARLLGSLPIAMAYTPMQQWKTTYSRDVALTVGTVFPELDLPFEGGRR